MSKPAPSLADVQSLAARCVEMADPQLDADFEAKFGLAPADFAALHVQAQAMHLQQQVTHKDAKNAIKRYALASQGSEAGLVWSVGGVWSASLIDQAPDLMTGPEVDAFHKKHPNAQVVDVLVYREALKAYNAGFDSVLDHSERSTPESRIAARDAGIKSLVRAGFPADALDVGRNEVHGQGNVEKHSNQVVQADLLGRNQAALAEKAFEAYNFGEGVTVAGASGWEYFAAGHERSREVYVENAIHDGKENSTTRLGFTVRFDPQTGALAEAYALDHKGQIWGSSPQGNAQELVKVYETGNDSTAWNSQVMRSDKGFEVWVFDADGDRRHEHEKSIPNQPDAIAMADRVVLPFQGNVQDNLGKAAILLEKIQQMHEQVDALLCDPAKQLIERIATASAEQVPALKLELQNFPNEPFYRSEIRTALIARETALRSITPDDSPSPGM